MAEGKTSVSPLPIGIATTGIPVTDKGYRSLLALWIGGAGNDGGVPPTPDANNIYPRYRRLKGR